MEKDQTNFLTRLEIINILRSRHLNIPDMDNLTYDELLRIFKAFAVPLQQRYVKERRLPPEYFYKVQTTFNFRDTLVDFQARAESHNLLQETQYFQHHSPHILQHAKVLKLSFSSIAHPATKRYGRRDDSASGPPPPKRSMITQ